jgi:IS30 family transposase
MNYNHLTINERCCIFQFKQSGMSIRKIAKALNRNASTISREIKRNSSEFGSRGRFKRYLPQAAQKQSEQRRENSHRPIKYVDEVRDYVAEKLLEHWSPEQIAHRECEYKLPSTSTIYRMIHRNHLKRVKMEHLRRKGKFNRPAETRGKFNAGPSIKKRPKSVYKRKELGHWEADTVESGRIDHQRKSNYCFVTLAERKSRYYIAILVPDRKAEHVTPAIINALKGFDSDLVKTITFDRGKEFSGYEEIARELECNVYFCDPYCAWQKGTNENSNGLLREFYPKGMDLSLVDEDELQHNLSLMNNRPRKCINFLTPSEALHI